MPKFMYYGEETDILQIIKKENKPVVVVMNPPYEKKRYKLMLDKMVRKIKNFRVFYYVSGAFLELNEIFNYKCRVIEGMYTSLKIFGLTNSPVAMLHLQFGKVGKDIIKDTITLPVYHPIKEKFDSWSLKYIRNITFKNKQTFKKQIEKQIADKYNSNEKLLASISFLSRPLIYNDGKGKYKICKSNLEDSLLFSGVLFNGHSYYYDGIIYATDKYLFNSFIADALMLAMCYTTNKTQFSFSIFSEAELGLPPHSLKRMSNDEYFYEFMNKYKNDLSVEGQDLRAKTLAMFRFYFKHFGINANKNVSLDELKLAIMQDNYRVSFKMTEGKFSVTGMGTNARIGVDSKWTPSKADRIHGTTIFTDYDKALLKLMTKMYERFIEYGMIDEMPKNVR